MTISLKHIVASVLAGLIGYAITGTFLGYVAGCAAECFGFIFYTVFGRRSG